jgi:hypothetical protein
VTEVEVPPLEARDLVEGLKQLLEAKRARYLFAVYGEGVEQTLKFDSHPDMHVLPVRSELELRAHMPALTEQDPRMVFLVPWTEDIPLDLAGRFARDGRVIRIGRESRLKTMFGVGEVDIEVQKSALADWILRTSPGQSFTLREGRLTHEALWGTWLTRTFGIETEGGLALDALLAWAATDVRSRAFREGAGAEAPIREELYGVLKRTLGPAGALAWRAWEDGHGRALLEYAVLFETLAESKDSGVRMWIKQKLKAELGVHDDGSTGEIALALGRSVVAALRYIERQGDNSDPRAASRVIVRAAEARADEVEIRAALTPSTRLPAAFDARLQALGDALGKAALAATPEHVRTAEERLHAVEGHALASEEEGARSVKRAWMAVRLAAWLAVRPDRAVSTSASPFDAVNSVGQWYAEEGGYVDWARRAARGTTSDAFGRGVQAVVHAADAARRELDRTFANGLVEWTKVGKPSTHALPIEKALERVAARFLEENDERRLLVLLLDGMAWAQAVELLDSLSRRSWGPLNWRARNASSDEGNYPVVLAALPSVTEISRSAFFASKPVAAGRSEDTQKDRERFRENKIMGKFFSGTEVPTLLLRAESHTKGGSASEEALRLVADTERRVVAIVVNAIDDSLKANPAMRHPWGVDEIASLGDLLDKARESGRAVLLASDHGHVPADLLEAKGTVSTGGARWRPLASETDPVHDFEVRFEGAKAWAPKGSWGVALMADETSRWGGSGHAGEHGGATLAEVVAPCVLVGAEDLRGVSRDEGLTVRSPYVPAWWHLGLETSAVEVPDVRPPVRTKQKVPAAQLPLLHESKPIRTPTPLPSRLLPGSTSAFSRSKVLDAVATDPMLRKQVVQAVDYLMPRKGTATSAAFAAEMGVLQRRVGGLVSTLQEALNVDGYEVLRFDTVAGHVILDTFKLQQLFEVPE